MMTTFDWVTCLSISVWPVELWAFYTLTSNCEDFTARTSICTTSIENGVTYWLLVIWAKLASTIFKQSLSCVTNISSASHSIVGVPFFNTYNTWISCIYEWSCDETISLVIHTIGTFHSSFIKILSMLTEDWNTWSPWLISSCGSWTFLASSIHCIDFISCTVVLDTISSVWCQSEVTAALFTISIL